MSIIGTSATRAVDQSDPAVTEEVVQQTKANVAYYALHPEEIDQRLQDLDEEWDVERWLELNSAILSWSGIALGMLHTRKWLLLPIAVQGFFLQHGLQGWCPPLPIFRQAGVRTQGEIEAERHALKAIRGDYVGSDINSGTDAFHAARQ